MTQDLKSKEVVGRGVTEFFASMAYHDSYLDGLKAIARSDYVEVESLYIQPGRKPGLRPGLIVTAS